MIVVVVFAVVVVGVVVVVVSFVVVVEYLIVLVEVILGVVFGVVASLRSSFRFMISLTICKRVLLSFDIKVCIWL